MICVLLSIVLHDKHRCLKSEWRGRLSIVARGGGGGGGGGMGGVFVHTRAFPRSTTVRAGVLPLPNPLQWVLQYMGATPVAARHPFCDENDLIVIPAREILQH